MIKKTIKKTVLIKKSVTKNKPKIKVTMKTKLEKKLGTKIRPRKILIKHKSTPIKQKKISKKSQIVYPKTIIELGKGLDVGTAFICCAQRGRYKTIYKSIRDAFFGLEYSDFAKQMLDRANIQYIRRYNKIYVVSEGAIQMANVFNKNTRRPMKSGVINANEKEALSVIKWMIKKTIGAPRYKGEIVYFSLPGQAIDANLNLTYHQNIIKDILINEDYRPKVINEGLAVIFSELRDENFTGLGISFGAGLVNVCLSYMAIPVFSFSIHRGGDWIDSQVAQSINEIEGKVCAIKEASLDLYKQERFSLIENALSIYYNELIRYVLEQITQKIEEKDHAPLLRDPISIVLAGGTAMPPGFSAMFKKSLRKIEFPLKIDRIKTAAHPLRAVAKGALIAATIEEKKGRRK